MFLTNFLPMFSNVHSGQLEPLPAKTLPLHPLDKFLHHLPTHHPPMHAGRRPHRVSKSVAPRRAALAQAQEQSDARIPPSPITIKRDRAGKRTLCQHTLLSCKTVIVILGFNGIPPFSWVVLFRCVAQGPRRHFIYPIGFREGAFRTADSTQSPGRAFLRNAHRVLGWLKATFNSSILDFLYVLSFFLSHLHSRNLFFIRYFKTILHIFFPTSSTLQQPDPYRQRTTLVYFWTLVVFNKMRGA